MAEVEILFLSIFDMIMIIFISEAFVNLDKIKISRVIYYILVGVICNGINNLLINNDVIAHILSTMIIFIWLKLFIKDKKLKLNDYMIIFILTFSFLFIMQMLSVIIIKIFISSFEYSFVYGLASQIIATIIAIIINRYVPIHNLYIFIEQKNIIFKILIINLYILYFLISILWVIKIDYILESIISITVIIMLSLVINTMLFKNGLINQVNKEKLEALETYLPIIDNVMEEFRAKQHDYHNHIQSLLTMKENPITFDSIAYNEYIKQMLSQDIWTYLIKLDNKIIMAFFYSKYKFANKKGIKINFKITNFFLKSIYNDYELVEMYGILIDNAIENSKCTDKKDISIILEFRDSMNLFGIINSSIPITPIEISKMFNYGYSTKIGIGRGVGLHKLKLMMEKRKGTITAYYDTNKEEMMMELTHR